MIAAFIFIGTVDSEHKGLLTKLPPWSDEIGDTLFLSARDVLTVDILTSDSLTVEGCTIHLKEVGTYIPPLLAHGRRPEYRYVLLDYPRDIRYATYLAVFDAILAGRKRRYDEFALVWYGHRYSDDMPFAHRKRIVLEHGVYVDDLNDDARPDDRPTAAPSANGVASPRRNPIFQ